MCDSALALYFTHIIPSYRSQSNYPKYVVRASQRLNPFLSRRLIYLVTLNLDKAHWPKQMQQVFPGVSPWRNLFRDKHGRQNSPVYCSQPMWDALMLSTRKRTSLPPGQVSHLEIFICMVLARNLFV